MRPRHRGSPLRVVGISAPRGDGKSLGAALVGLWPLLAGPPGQDILSAARQRMMSAYNQKHGPDQVRLATDLETYLSAITNYAAMVKRELRTVLK